MRAASILLLLGAVTVGIVLPAAGYCDFWLRGAGAVGIEFGRCGREPNLNHVGWVVTASLRGIAAAIFAISVVLFLSAVRNRRGAS